MAGWADAPIASDAKADWSSAPVIRPASEVSSSLKVSSPEQNWSNVGAESLHDAGIKPALTDAELLKGRLMAAVPFNLGDETAASLASTKDRFTPQEQPEYDAALTAARDVQHRYEGEHPVESLAASVPGNIAATMAIPGGPLVQGAVGGAATGFGAGEGEADRAIKAGIGLGLGAVTAAGTTSLAGFLERKAIPPLARGADFVQNIADKSGIDIDNLAASSKPLTSAEAIGPQAETHLMALARREGATGGALAPEMAQRAAMRPDRIFDDMADAAGIHPEAAKGDIDALVHAGQQAAAPLFKAALSQPGPVWNGSLARLAQRPAIQKAMKLAAEDLRNADKNPAAMGLEIDPAMGATGEKQLQPTAEAWDIIRRNLAGTVERDGFGKPIPDSISRGNHNINQASRDLTAALKDPIPGYSEALATSGDYLSAKAAFDQGQKSILNNNVTADQFSQAIAKMSPAEQEALKGGIANKLFDLAQNGRLRPAQFLTDKAQAKLAAALGPDQAKAFAENLDEEVGMRAFEMRAAPSSGSQTAPLSQAMKDQDSFGHSQAAQDALDALQAGGGSAHATALSWVSKQLGRGTQKIGDYLKTSGLSPEARDAAGKLLMLPPEDLATALRGANVGPQGAMGKAGGLINQYSPVISSIPPLLMTHRAAATQ